LFDQKKPELSRERQWMRLLVILLLGLMGSPSEASQQLRDCSDCPEMVVVPAGQFQMGAKESERGRLPAELPQHLVTISVSFAIGKFDVTRAQFAKFATATNYQADKKCDWRAPKAHGNPINQSDLDPVVCVSWRDAAAYATWLSQETGKRYRLASEAEWEYAARAGSSTARPWGDEITRDDANYGTAFCCAAAAEGKDRWLYTSPVGAFPANAFGLYDMLGNVWQWTQDCGHPNYAGAPIDGSAWITGDCSQHMVRGGAWFQSADSVRSAARAGDSADFRIGDIGFRVARSV
jgi:formylglycine-generating enzyme required for sulfatase activity